MITSVRPRDRGNCGLSADRQHASPAPQKLEKQDPPQTPVKASIFLESNAEYILGQGLIAHPMWVLPGEGKPPFP